MVATAEATEAGKLHRARARIGAGGRLVIPAEMRRALGMDEGETVVLCVENGELRVWTVAEGIRRAQAIASKYVRSGVSIVDELIAERRAEDARDEEEARLLGTVRE